MLRKFDKNLPDLNGKNILVTGATGSFGRAFVKLVLARWKPARLVVFSRDEFKQYEMEQTSQFPTPPKSQVFHRRRPGHGTVGDGHAQHRHRRPRRGAEACAHCRIQSLRVHPHQRHGAENVVRAASADNVKRVIALSTDKAVQSGQPLWRDQAGVGKDLHCRQQPTGGDGHPLLGGSLRQRPRLARQRRAVFQEAGRRRRPTPCRSPISA